MRTYIHSIKRTKMDVRNVHMVLYLLFIYSMQSSHYVKRNKRIKHHLTWWRRGACNCHKHRSGLNVLVVVVGVMFAYTPLYLKFNSIDAAVKRGVFEFEIYLKRDNWWCARGKGCDEPDAIINFIDYFLLVKTHLFIFTLS